MRIRTSFAALLAATIIALAAPTTAEAVPAGFYFLDCRGGQLVVHNHLGFLVARGRCGGGDWSVLMVVHPRAQSPVAPTLDPPEDDVWQGASASEWVAYVGQLTAVDEDEYIDPTELQGGLPTLTCNEAHFDPEG